MEKFIDYSKISDVPGVSPNISDWRRCRAHSETSDKLAVSCNDRGYTVREKPHRCSGGLRINLSFAFPTCYFVLFFPFSFGQTCNCY